VQSSRHYLLRLTWLISFGVALPLLGFSQTSSPSDTQAAPTNITPAGQAPDEVMKKLSDLIRAGKYTEAQQLTTGLLMAYPNDQRLIKAKALLDKALASSSESAEPATSSHPLTNGASHEPINTNSEQLTGMDKVDYNALIELARQAQQTTDLEQQKASLCQFMEQSSPFLHKHPNETLLWQLRAASAISLNQPMAGFEAGQQLLAAGGADSSDADLQRLLAQLRNKGWLDRQQVETLYQQQRYIQVAFLGEAADKPTSVNLRTKLMLDMTALLVSQYPSRQTHYTSPVPGDPTPIVTVTINVHGTTLSPCTYSMVKNVWKCPAQTALTVVASSPEGWKFTKDYTFAGGTSGVGWGTPRTPLNAVQIDAWISHGVVGAFKEILDADAVRASLHNSTAKPAPPDAHSSLAPINLDPATAPLARAWAAHSKLYIVPTGQPQLECKRMEELKIDDVSVN
jgi:hypothetical protein